MATDWLKSTAFLILTDFKALYIKEHESLNKDA